jgi:hypothetical protein
MTDNKAMRSGVCCERGVSRISNDLIDNRISFLIHFIVILIASTHPPPALVQFQFQFQLQLLVLLNHLLAGMFRKKKVELSTSEKKAVDKKTAARHKKLEKEVEKERKAEAKAKAKAPAAAATASSSASASPASRRAATVGSSNSMLDRPKEQPKMSYGWGDMQHVLDQLPDPPKHR